MSTMTLEQAIAVLNPEPKSYQAIEAWKVVRAHLAQPAQAVDVDSLAQEIRRVDGMHMLGAGALAEALMPFITRALTGEKAGRVDGWKLVPIEPTSAMLAAAQGENVAKGQRQLPRYGTLRRKWAAMLAASPAPDKEG